MSRPSSYSSTKWALDAAFPSKRRAGSSIHLAAASLGRDRPIADRQRARLAHVHIPREPVHGPLDGDVEPPDNVLDLGFRDDQRRREAEVVLHGDTDDAFERAVVADALGHYRIGDLAAGVLDDVEHAVEALAAHVADAGILALERQ